VIRFDCALRRPDFAFDAAFEGGPGVTALFGPSGSGKSTAIHLIAGFERPDRGRIALGERTLLDTATGRRTPPHRRRVGVVFQDAKLLPHLSVRANLLFGRWFTPRAERRVGFDAVVQTLGIGHLLSRRPATLSGGERQRVAIGRALLTSPRLLLLDEPLAALDADRKLEVLPFIETLRDEFGIPMVYVSHAVEEVARLATRVVRLEGGRVTAVGAPAEVLAPSAVSSGPGRFEAISVLTTTVRGFLPDYGVTLLDHPAGVIVAPGRVEPTGDGGAGLRVAIRATSVTLAVGRPGNMSVRSALAGTVTRIEADGGPFALVTVTLEGGDRVRAYATRLGVDALGLGVGDAVQALIKAVAIEEGGVPGLRLVDGRE
jgi:molybdate transport system ATP-binding protein